MILHHEPLTGVVLDLPLTALGAEGAVSFLSEFDRRPVDVVEVELVPVPVFLRPFYFLISDDVPSRHLAPNAVILLGLEDDPEKNLDDDAYFFSQRSRRTSKLKNFPALRAMSV